MSAFQPMDLEKAYPLELATGNTTILYGSLGANVVWGFSSKREISGVAIFDAKTKDQVVITCDNLRLLIEMMEAYA